MIDRIGHGIGKVFSDAKTVLQEVKIESKYSLQPASSTISHFF